MWAGGAEAVEVCPFDEDGRETRCPLPAFTHGIWPGLLPGGAAGPRVPAAAPPLAAPGPARPRARRSST
ncbi:hypothetical protein, partial [Streptomyces albidoflavus]|uniref:hypothetical protein n=1 Tax=Streptomyces albidoflavus TaxID=1886 RepID=UPI00211D07E1